MNTSKSKVWSFVGTIMVVGALGLMLIIGLRDNTQTKKTAPVAVSTNSNSGTPQAYTIKTVSDFTTPTVSQNK